MLGTVSLPGRRLLGIIGNARSGIRLAAVLLAAAVGVQASTASAAVYTYTPTNTSTDFWSAGTGWTGGTAPVSATTTELTFVASNATVIAAGWANSSNNDITTGLGPNGGFLLNILDLQGTGPASGAVPTIGTTGATQLEFAANSGINPVINLNALKGTVGLTYNIGNNIILDNTTTVQGSGTATFKLSGDISGAGGLVKSGNSALQLNGMNSYLGGTTINAGILQYNTTLSLSGYNSTPGSETANVTVNSGGTAAANFALDQSTVSLMTAGSTGTVAQVVATTATNSNDLNFSNTGASFGVVTGVLTYSGALTPNGTVYRLGGGGGTLAVNSTLSGAGNSLMVCGGGSAGTVTLGTAGTYGGGTTVTGVTGSTAGVLQTNILSGTSTAPFGATTGAIELNNGTLGLGTATPSLVAGNVINVAGYDVTYKGQNTIKLSVGSGDSVTFAANSLTAGSQGGVLLLSPSSSANLGTKEIVTLPATPAMTNGMVAPYYIDGANRFFLTYGASGKTGFSDATATKTANGTGWTSTLGSTSTDIVDVTGYTISVTGPVSAYAARVTNSSGFNQNLNGVINIGAGGLILANTGGGNGFANSSGNVSFGSNPGYLGAFATSGSVQIGNTVTGTAGLTVYGNTALQLVNPITFTGGLTIAGGAVYVANNSSQYFNALTPNPLTILKGGSFNWTNSGGATFASISGDGLLQNTGSAAARSFTLNGGDGTGTTTFSGLISTPGSGGYGITLTKNGSTTQILTGANTYVGSTTVNGGVLKLSGAGTIGLSTLAVNPGGTVTLDNASANADRIADTATVSLGGNLNLIGNASANTSETAGAVTPAAGPAIVTLTPDSTKSALLTFASLGTRAVGHTALYRGTGLSSALGPNTSNIIFSTGPTVSTGGTFAATDGTGALGGTAAAVLHGALFDSTATGGGAGFATYDAANNGVRLLNASSEQVSTYPGVSDYTNVKLTLSGATPITGVTTNTLQLDNTSGSAVIVTNTGTALNPQNGLLFTGTSAITLTGGTFTQPAGTSDLVVLSSNTAGVTINTALTNNGATSGTTGVTIGGSGDITLKGTITLASDAATGNPNGYQYFNINNTGTTTLGAALRNNPTTQRQVFMVTNVNAGTLKLTTGGSLGTPANPSGASGSWGVNPTVVVASGATLDLNGINLSLTKLSGTDGGGTITNTSGATATLSLLGVPAYDYDAINGISATKITGNLNVSINTPSVYRTFTQTLSGNNSYTGTTTLNTQAYGWNTGYIAQLNINSPTAISTGQFIITKGSFDNTSGYAITLSTNNTQAWNNSFAFVGANALNMGTGAVTLGIANPTVTVVANTLTIGGPVDGAANYGFTKAGVGTLVLGGTNAYTGTTTVNAGTLTVNAGATLSAATAPLVVSNPNTGTGTTGTNVVVNLNSSQTVGPLSGTISTPASGTNTATINLIGSGTNLAVNQTAAGSFAGTLAGAGGFGLGSGSNNVLTLTGANTYTGPTTITAGTLSVGASANLGGAASNLVFDGGTLQITGTSLTNFSGIGHTVLLNAGKTVGLDINNAANTFTADQVLNQTSGGFTKLGAGTAVMDQINTYTGVTAVKGGTLRVTGSIAGTSVTVDSSAVLNLANTGGTALAAGTPYASVTNDGTMNVSSLSEQAGAVSGVGSTSVNGSLTADSIVQNSLSISAGATVTIRETTGGAVNAVPEPGTWVLIGTALLGLLAFRRRLRG
jgi:fibronectin-binding autotransporter adhesin